VSAAGTDLTSGTPEMADTGTSHDASTATGTSVASPSSSPPSSSPSSSSPSSSSPSPAEALPAAAAPVLLAPAAAVSVLLCLGLIALGVLALREALLGREVAGTVLVPGEAWFSPLLGSATSVVPGTVAVLSGTAAALLGLLLLVLALRPRRVRTLRLVDPTGSGVPIDLDPADVGDLAAHTALADGEVGTSRAHADRRRVGLHLTVDPRDPHDVAALTTATLGRVDRRLADVRPTPRVRVTVHGARA